MTAPYGPFPAIVHPFESPTPCSCAYELGPSSSRNTLVFIGGLGDGPHTVPYVRTIARELESAEGLSYSVFEVRLSSSFTAFGYSRLSDDVTHLSALVKYLRGLGKEKIVFLGHSTGCQDCVEYTNYAKHKNEAVDGFILQGPVSDREAVSLVTRPEEVEASLATARGMIQAGKEDDIMPREQVAHIFRSPMTAYRWNSLLCPGGDDDFFSSDLSNSDLAVFWGRFRKPVLILPSAEDEYVPAAINVMKNMARWNALLPPGMASDLSGLIPGASHSVTDAEAQLWMAGRVIQFLGGL